MIRIEADLCPQDHKCPAVSACPVGALKQKGLAAPTIDHDICISCGLCVSVCPTAAIRWE